MVKRSHRLVALFAAVIILFEVAVVPQKAKAVALTASVVASVAAIMTACGVTYWAASQTDAIEYLGGKIDDYLGSLETVPQSYEDWLGINASSQLFEVVSGGVMRFGSGVANKVLDFVRWFNTEEGVVSGGPSVGASTLPSGWAVTYSGDDYDGGWSADLTGVNTVSVSMDAFSKAGTGLSYMTVLIPVTGLSCQIQLVEVSGTPRMTVRLGTSTSQISCQSAWTRSRDAGLSDGFVTLTFIVSNVSSYHEPFSGTSVFTLFPDYDVARDYTSEVTPSPVVAVPDALDDADSFDVAPSVPLSQGMTVEQASEAVLDGVSSEDGLSSVGEAVDAPVFDLSGILEALGSILNAILSIPSHIANGVQSIVTTLGEKVDAFKDAVHGFLTTFDNYLYDIRQRVTEMAHDITMLISDRLEYLFVPDEIYVQNYVQSIMHLFDGRVGILTFPLSVFVDFLTRFSSISDGDHSFHWGNINEPFSGRQVIAAGSYNLDDAVASSPMSTVYSVYLVVVKAVIAFWFLRLCQRKYELIVNGH